MNLPQLAVIVLVAAVLSTALGVVYAEHRSRALFTELQAQQATRDELETEWGRLQLEQSTYATHSRVERLAREELNMSQPDPGSVVIVRP